jgi:hypothetical protein
MEVYKILKIYTDGLQNKLHIGKLIFIYLFI